MMTPERLGTLLSQLTAAGIPCHGVRDGDPPTVDFADAAADQRRQAASIVAAFDQRPRRNRTFAARLAAVQSLAQADRTKLLNAMLAEFLGDYPRIGAAVGVSIEGDEAEA